MIDEIMASDRYRSPDKRERLLEVAKVSILSRIAHREPASSQQRARPQPRLENADRAADRAELSKLMQKGSALMEAGAPGHKEAVERFHQLVARIG